MDFRAKCEKLVDDTIEIAEQFLKAGKQYPPTLACLLDSGTVFATQTPPVNTDADKKRLNHVFNMAAQLDNVEIAFVTLEAWVLKAPTKEDMDKIVKEHGSIGNHPDRGEVLTFSFLNRAGERLFVVCDIDREKLTITKGDVVSPNDEGTTITGEFIEDPDKTIH